MGLNAEAASLFAFAIAIIYAMFVGPFLTFLLFLNAKAV